MYIYLAGQFYIYFFNNEMAMNRDQVFCLGNTALVYIWLLKDGFIAAYLDSSDALTARTVVNFFPFLQ